MAARFTGNTFMNDADAALYNAEQAYTPNMMAASHGMEVHAGLPPFTPTIG